MPDIEGGMARYDLNDPEDLQVLIRTGLIWKGGPKSTQKAIRALVDGTATRVVAKERPEVTAYLDKLGVPQDEPAPEDGPPPAEPTDLDEEPGEA